MNGPSHYLESEEWIERAAGTPQYEARMEMLAAAQVHATLALAAATSENAPHGPWTVAT